MSMKFHENVLKVFQVIEGTQNYHCLMMFYIYEVSLKCLKRFWSYSADTKLTLLNFKGE